MEQNENEMGRFLLYIGLDGDTTSLADVGLLIGIQGKECVLTSLDCRPLILGC